MKHYYIKVSWSIFDKNLMSQYAGAPVATFLNSSKS